MSRIEKRNAAIATKEKQQKKEEEAKKKAVAIQRQRVEEFAASEKVKAERKKIKVGYKQEQNKNTTAKVTASNVKAKTSEVSFEEKSEEKSESTPSAPSSTKSSTPTSTEKYRELKNKRNTDETKRNSTEQDIEPKEETKPTEETKPAEEIESKEETKQQETKSQEEEIEPKESFTIEKRIDSDGQAYTSDEFLEHYGGMDEWKTAELASSQQKETPKKMIQTIEEEFGDVFKPKVLLAYRALFSEYDTDNSGDIDADELQFLLEAAGKKISILEIGKLIEEVDAIENGGNADGKVNENEFLRMLNNNRGPNVFAQITKDRASNATERRKNMEALKKQKTITKLENDKAKQRRKTKQLANEAERLAEKNKQKELVKEEFDLKEKLKTELDREELDKEWSKPRFAIGGVVTYTADGVAQDEDSKRITKELENEFGDSFDDPTKLAAYRSLFSEYDTDNSGDIDADELQFLLEAAGKKISILEIGKLIEEVDAIENGGNGDGKINLHEFLRMLSNNRGPNVLSEVTKSRYDSVAERRKIMVAEELRKVEEKLELDKEKQRRKTKQLADEAERLAEKNRQKEIQKEEWELKEKVKLVGLICSLVLTPLLLNTY